MIEWLAALASAVLGGVFAWSGGLKLVGRRAAAAARRSALATLIGATRAPTAFRVLGAVEIALALALLLPPVHVAEPITAIALTVGFLGYLGYARVSAPEAGCGCMGTRRTPVTWRSIARAAVLLLTAALSTQAATSWLAALQARPVAGTAVLAAAGALMVVLSPEADHHWLFPLRRLRVRVSHPLAESGRGADAPLEASLQQLHNSPAFQQVGASLRSAPRETWDEGRTRILCYTADYDGRRATAVFAVPLDRYEPEAVRVALVDEESQEVLPLVGADAARTGSA